MNSATNSNEKRIYITPLLIDIKLDNEISLLLQSTLTPPEGPDESRSNLPEFFKNNPFEKNLG